MNLLGGITYRDPIFWLQVVLLCVLVFGWTTVVVTST